MNNIQINDQNLFSEIKRISTLPEAFNIMVYAGVAAKDGRRAIIKTLIEIKDKRLYSEETDNEGEHFSSFIAFLDHSKNLLTKLSDYKLDVLKKYMKNYIVFNEIGYNDEQLEDLGSHVMLLLPAARTKKLKLLDETIQQANGTLKLGKEEFKQLADYINQMLGFVPFEEDNKKHWQNEEEYLIITGEDKLDYIAPGMWSIENTKEHVAKIRQIDNITPPKPRIIVRVTQDGDKIKIDNISINQLSGEIFETTLENLILLKKQLHLVVEGIKLDDFEDDTN